MKTFLNLLYKDFLLLIRDKAGLLLLFAMPLALVLYYDFHARRYN
jgi:hypothetical protein